MKRYILTGERAAGKTTFCRTLARAARERGVRVVGILTLTVRNEGLTALDLAGGGMNPLAKFAKGDAAGGKTGGSPRTERWEFLAKTLEWGNRMIREADPAGLFILDEAGILEFRKGQGWTEGMLRADGGIDQIALIVVRRGLIEAALKRWPDAEVFEIDREDRGNDGPLIRRILGPLSPEASGQGPCPKPEIPSSIKDHLSFSFFSRISSERA